MKKLILILSLLFVTITFAQYESSYTGAEVDAGIRPYKVYTALLTQSGTTAPVATVLENTIGGVPVWSYISVGLYRITLTSAFSLNKTVTFVNAGTINNIVVFGILQANANSLYLYVFDTIGEPIDEELNKVSFEIRVYP